MKIPYPDFKISIIADNADYDALTLFRRHLLVLSKIDIWDVRDIKPGENTVVAIHENIRSSHIIILLISKDFFLPDFDPDFDLLKAIIGFQKEKLVVPVLIKPCAWKINPEIKKVANNILPSDETPVSTAPDQDKIWSEITEKLAEKLAELKEQFCNDYIRAVTDEALKTYLVDNDAEKFYRAVREYESQDAFSPDVCFYLGELYEYGAGGAKQNFHNANYFYQFAEQSGHVEATFRSGELYFHGIGVDRDLTFAEISYKGAANSGHIEAQFSLAKLYEEQFEVKAALFWYDKAIKNLYPKAIEAKKDLELAIAEEEAIMNLFNQNELRVAFNRLQMHQTSGYGKIIDPLLYYEIGRLYYYGLPQYIETNEREAYKYLEKGAQRKEMNCCFLIGIMFEDADYFSKAKEWYQKAHELGHPDAEAALKALEA